MKSLETLQCPYCGSTKIILDPKTQQYVCQDCASVISTTYSVTEIVTSYVRSFKNYLENKRKIEEKKGNITPHIQFLVKRQTIKSLEFVLNRFLEKCKRELEIIQKTYNISIDFEEVQDDLISLYFNARKKKIRLTKPVRCYFYYLMLRNKGFYIPLEKLKQLFDVTLTHKVKKIETLLKQNPYFSDIDLNLLKYLIANCFTSKEGIETIRAFRQVLNLVYNFLKELKYFQGKKIVTNTLVTFVLAYHLLFPEITVNNILNTLFKFEKVRNASSKFTILGHLRTLKRLFVIVSS